MPFPTRLLLAVALGWAAVPHAQVQAQTQPPPVQWRTDYASARREAAAKNLPIVIYFGRVSCFWCKKMDETTLKVEAIARLLNERFIPLKIDTDQDRELTEKLRINGLPTTMIASADGRILQTLESYQERDAFGEVLQRTLATVAPPDWLQRDLAHAARCVSNGEYARAIPLLRAVLDDAKGRAYHADAERLLADVERVGSERFARARQLQDNGQAVEAHEALTEVVRLFPGLAASRDASDLLAKNQQQPSDQRLQVRARRAKELLAQAQDFYRNKEFAVCLDRCEVLQAHYGDLPEAGEAANLLQELRSPEILLGTAEALAERLANTYLGLAESHLRRGDRQRCEFYLHRVLHAFPGSRQAESAQLRLQQMQTSAAPVQSQSARP